jgi:hypothetical protein
MSFVLPERQRPSYWALTSALRRGVLISGTGAVVSVQLATAGESLAPTTVALVALPLSLPGGVWLTRIFLERRTGYAVPWWIAAIGVCTSWVATPWAGGWLAREILAGTFGGLDLEPGSAPSVEPAPLPLAYQTGLDYVPPPVPVAPAFVEALPEPELLAPLRVVAIPMLDGVAPAPLPEPLSPEPLAAPLAPEPFAEAPAALVEAPAADAAPAFPLPELPAPAPVELVAAALAFPLPLPEPPAPPPHYEPEPEPVEVAASTEQALAEAPPIVVEHVAPLHVLPPLEEQEMPFFLPPSELEPAAAHDPFSTFWLDPEAPSPEGLTPGYLPPLTGMWRTPLGDKL